MWHTTTLWQPRQVSSASKLMVWTSLYVCAPKINSRITENCWKHTGYSDKNLKCGYGMYCGCISHKLPAQEFYPCMHRAGPLGLKNSVQKGFPWLLGHHVAVGRHWLLATLGASSLWSSVIGWGRERRGMQLGDLSSSALSWTHFVIFKYFSISSLVRILF